MSYDEKMHKGIYGHKMADEIEMPPADYDHPLLKDEPIPRVPANAVSIHPEQKLQNERIQVEEIIQESPQEDDTDETEEVIEEIKPTTKPQVNFKILREKAEQERIRAERAERELEMMRSQMYTPRKEVEQEEEDFDRDLRDDDILEGKHHKKFKSVVDRKVDRVERKLQEYEEKLYNATQETRILRSFPDFDDVVTEENVAILEELEPEIVTAIRSTKDNYAKAASAYKMIKKYEIYQDNKETAQKKLKVIENNKKPRPSTSIAPKQTENPLYHANAFADDLTPEKMKAIDAERRRYAMMAR